MYIECSEYRPLTEYPSDYDYFEHAEVSQEDNGCAMTVMGDIVTLGYFCAESFEADTFQYYGRHHL